MLECVAATMRDVFTGAGIAEKHPVGQLVAYRSSLSSKNRYDVLKFLHSELEVAKAFKLVQYADGVVDHLVLFIRVAIYVIDCDFLGLGHGFAVLRLAQANRSPFERFLQSLKKT